MLFTKLLLNKKMDDVEIVDKNDFEIMTVSSNLVPFCRFYDHNRKFYSVYMIREICVFC